MQIVTGTGMTRVEAGRIEELIHRDALALLGLA